MSQQQRRDEILAKKAKLAELKKQREARTKDASASRQSIGAAIEVWSFLGVFKQLLNILSLQRLRQEGLIVEGR